MQTMSDIQRLKWQHYVSHNPSESVLDVAHAPRADPSASPDPGRDGYGDIASRHASIHGSVKGVPGCTFQPASQISANHRFPQPRCAVGFGHVQPRRTDFIRMEMGTCIEQRLYVVLEPCARRQEQRRVAGAIAEVD